MAQPGDHELEPLDHQSARGFAPRLGGSGARFRRKHYIALFKDQPVSGSKITRQRITGLWHEAEGITSLYSLRRNFVARVSMPHSTGSLWSKGSLRCPPINAFKQIGQAVRA